MALFGDGSEDEVLARFSNYAQARGALKRGLEGPRAINQAEDGGQEFAAIAAVVDSTGAGDGFNAGYLAALWQTGSQREALASGHELASRIVRQRGAIIAKEELAGP